MSTKEKLIQKVLEEPPRRDIEFEDAEKVLNEFKFNTTRIAGSHCIFKNLVYPSIELDAIPIPHGGKKCLRPAYIDKIQEAIKRFKEMENSENEKNKQ